MHIDSLKYILGFEVEGDDFEFEKIRTTNLFDYVAGKSLFSNNKIFEDKICIQESYDYFNIIGNPDHSLSEVESLLLDCSIDQNLKVKEQTILTRDNILQVIDLYDICWEGDRINFFINSRLKQSTIKKSRWKMYAIRMMTKLRFLLVSALLANWNKGIKFSRVARMISKSLSVKRSMFNKVYKILTEINSNGNKQRFKTLVDELEL